MPTLRLPLFPLGLVLFPGADAPLHIFEPRYRQLLADVTAGDRRFGLVPPPPDTPERAIAAGRIGAVAQVGAVEMLPDGRADIVVSGIERFVFQGWVDDPAPYRVGLVEPFDDEPEPADALAPAAVRVRELALRALLATFALRDLPGEPATLADEPAALSFQVAAMLSLDADDRYALLASRRAGDRLALLEARLGAGVRTVEARAELHQRAKTNGHSHGPIPG
ncbi:MAG: LON peptidase substrate-binding domain-containing protein [Gemmatimonadaceae bacterium]|nr:LON peptidase substrate-binding domain-containing protein [Gemmatimonadaceae bacterium]